MKINDEQITNLRKQMADEMTPMIEQRVKTEIKAVFDQKLERFMTKRISPSSNKLAVVQNSRR